MRIARFEGEFGPRVGVVVEDTIRPLPAHVGVLDLLSIEPADRDRIAHDADQGRPLSTVRLLPPVEPPSIRDFSVFEAHIEGAVKTLSADALTPPVWHEMPFCYFSNPHAITGPGDKIAMAPGTNALDFELEVAAIIARPGRNLTPAEAGAHIGGFTIFNDWSARDIGAKEIQTPFGQCKGKDFANTLGPWIVTPDELEPYRDGDRYDLDLRAAVNEVKLGSDTLANMAWSFEELVSYASRGTWVKPGDVLGTGTCGNGCLLEFWGRRGTQDPPPLKPGDLVSLSVEGIGTLNNCVTEGLELIKLPPARPRGAARIAV